MTDYIVTYTKKKFNPFKPAAEDIVIEDIAHSLSLMTRANGHIDHFYSVAQHAINCYKEAKIRGYSERIQLGCLLHDASESYVSDLTRPVKAQLPAYVAVDEKLQSLIYKKFGLGDLSLDEKLRISKVDDSLLHYELTELKGMSTVNAPPVKYMDHDFSLRDFVEVELEFINTFNRLAHVKRGLSSEGID